MDTLNNTAVYVINFLQFYIRHLGFKPLVHFELEGCFQVKPNDNNYSVDYKRINQQLKQLDIDGELVPEYWLNQWEYISLFNGQSPLKEAHNLTHAIQKLPKLFKQQHIDKTLIKPVVWSGDKGKLVSGSKNIFTNDRRSVHIPNAIQLNISALNSEGENIIAHEFFGEYLQQCFLNTSLSCCLLYLPEEEAYERLLLRDKYGLLDELCSPNNISGGHQGSIALYKEIGKHNQLMGVEPLIYDRFDKALVSVFDWKKTARVEHRLGASSVHYNAYVNVVFGLLNLIQALELYLQEQCKHKVRANTVARELPLSLRDHNNKKGAITLFEDDPWFSQMINLIEDKVTQLAPDTYKSVLTIGDTMKTQILQQYKQPVITSLPYS